MAENIKLMTTVIYHRSDFDGIFCREIAKKFLGNETILIGWDYSDPVPDVPQDHDLFMLDISVEKLMDHPRLIWIDHHKSAIEKFNSAIKGYRIDGVAACRLAWQWFSGFVNTFGNDIPIKEDYIERRVTEPLAVRLAGEYDIWDRRDSRAELLQHGLRSQELTENLWDLLLVAQSKLDDKDDIGTIAVEALLDRGEAIQYFQTEQNKSIIKAFGFDVVFEHLQFLACNNARFNSLLFTEGLRPEHDACMGFNWTGKLWRVSLYHAPGKEHHDLSAIAVKYGGGGHRGACGFTAAFLPFGINMTIEVRKASNG